MRNTNRVTLASRAVALVGSSLMAVALLASPVHAGPGKGSQAQSDGSGHVECDSGPDVIVTGDFDSVTVPPGGTCLLRDSTVAGNVTAEEDSRLFARSNSIGGNLVGDTHDTLQAVFNRIGGNVRMQDGTGASGGATHELCGNFINGNIALQRNSGTILVGEPLTDCGGNFVAGNVSVTDSLTNFPDSIFEVRGNLVGGHMQIIDNAGDGPKLVQNNLVGRTLSCFGNENPFIGTPNDAEEARGQCAP